MRIARFFAPGVTPVISPARSPGWAIALPVLLMRAPTVSCGALDRFIPGAIAMPSSRVKESGRAFARRRKAAAARRAREDEDGVGRRSLSRERGVERHRAADARRRSRLGGAR